MKYDVIIVGSGLGGLACGVWLSGMGKRVLVLEQGRQPGGCLQSYRRGGLAFDTGFHYVGGLGEGQSLHAAFRSLGLLGLPWQRLAPEGFDRVVVGDRTFRFAEGFDAFAAALASDFPAEHAALQRYAGLLRECAAHQFDTLRPGAVPPPDEETWMNTGAWDYLQREFRDPLLRNVLSGTALKMELRRESLPLFTFLHGQSSYVESSWRLRGDGSMIVDRLVQRLRRAGGELVCGARVDELEEKDGRVTRARCAQGESYEGEVFISDLHPAATCRLLRADGALRPVYRRRLSQLTNTGGMFTVSIRLRPHSLPYFNYNLYVYPQPRVWDLPLADGHVGGVMVSCRPPADGSPYTAQVDLLTPMAWDRCRAWGTSAEGHLDAAYRALKSRMAAECIALAARYVPELREGEATYTSTPLTWNRYTLTPEGSAYGVRKDFRNPLGTLLSPRTPLPNLLLTGQSLVLHGLHGVTMTALHTCAALVGREAVWHLLQETD